MKKLTTEEFINRAKEKHGDKYDYSKVEYHNAKTKVCIICPIHGEFWQNPYSHLGGGGCNICGEISSSEKQKKTNKDFILEAKKIHGDRYDYSKTCYTHSKNKVIITCPIHGDFIQRASAHLVGRGCPQCGEIKRHVELRSLKRGVGMVLTKDSVCEEKSYSIWSDMLRRCYSEKDRNKWISYKDCSICNEWLIYDNFKEWFDKNYIDGFDLDKDILVQGNKVYSPETCCFVPHEINSFFRKYPRGSKNLPTGIRKVGEKYQASIFFEGKSKYLGLFENIKDAHSAYIEQKKKNVTYLLNKWGSFLPSKVCDAILNYNFENV